MREDSLGNNRVQGKWIIVIGYVLILYSLAFSYGYKITVENGTQYESSYYELGYVTLIQAPILLLAYILNGTFFKIDFFTAAALVWVDMYIPLIIFAAISSIFSYKNRKKVTQSKFFLCVLVLSTLMALEELFYMTNGSGHASGIIISCIALWIVAYGLIKASRSTSFIG